MPAKHREVAWCPVAPTTCSNGVARGDRCQQTAVMQHGKLNGCATQLSDSKRAADHALGDDGQ
jgi:hypothetical protein